MNNKKGVFVLHICNFQSDAYFCSSFLNGLDGILLGHFCLKTWFPVKYNGSSGMHHCICSMAVFHGCWAKPTNISYLVTWILSCVSWVSTSQSSPGSLVWHNFTEIGREGASVKAKGQSIYSPYKHLLWWLTESPLSLYKKPLHWGKTEILPLSNLTSSFLPDSLSYTQANIGIP